MRKTIKRISVLAISTLSLLMVLSCSNKSKKWEAGNKELFCGKEFYGTQSIEQIGMTVQTITKLNCDGTYTSREDWKADEPNKDEYNSTVGRSSDNNYNFSGTWEVVTNIPE